MFRLASLRRRGANPTGGFSLLEMLITATCLLILASVVVPMAKNSLKRQKELELRRVLREMRTSIDNYKLAVDQQRIKPPAPENMGYPETLDALVEGAPLLNSTMKVRFLRRIPVDPFTGTTEWRLRSINDELNATSWGGGNVFDVHSTARGAGFNGIPYREW